MVLIKTFSLKPGRSCSLEIPKEARILNMQERAGQVQVYLIFKESSPVEERHFLLAYDDEVIDKEIDKLVYIASAFGKNAWNKSMHLFEVSS